MPEAKDLNNNAIIRNYVAMPDRRQFSALEVCSATGVCMQTVRNVLNDLCRDGVVVRLAKRIKGRTYYRQADAIEGLVRECIKKGAVAVAKERGLSKEAIYQKLRPHVDLQAQKATPHQIAAMKLIDAGKDPVGYRASLVALEKKGWIAVKPVVVENIYISTKYALTDQGREVLNAKG